jgi:hypothetical protein
MKEEVDRQIAKDSSRSGWRNLFHPVVVALMVLVVGNVIFLNFKILNSGNGDLANRLGRLEKKIDSLAIGGGGREETGASLSTPAESAAPASVSESMSVSTASPLPEPTPVPTGASLQTVYVTLGSASSNSQSWVDTSAQITLDVGEYGVVKQAQLIASLRADSGIIWARLVRGDTGFYLYDSEISNNTPNSTVKTSGNISLPLGTVQYIVQMRTQLPQAGAVENARLKLLVQK